jgi:hypothetical protein
VSRRERANDPAVENARVPDAAIPDSDGSNGSPDAVVVDL